MLMRMLTSWMGQKAYDASYNAGAKWKENRAYKQASEEYIGPARTFIASLPSSPGADRVVAKFRGAPDEQIPAAIRQLTAEDPVRSLQVQFYILRLTDPQADPHDLKVINYIVQQKPQTLHAMTTEVANGAADFVRERSILIPLYRTLLGI